MIAQEAAHGSLWKPLQGFKASAGQTDRQHYPNQNCTHWFSHPQFFEQCISAKGTLETFFECL